MSRFQVDRYDVKTEIQRLQTSAGVQTFAARSLIIVSTPTPAGGVTRAALHFSALFDPWYGRPVVGQLDATDFLFPVISAWFPLAEFASFYDILRTERPLLLSWEMREDGATAGFLRHISLGTLCAGERQQPLSTLFQTL